MKKLLYLSYVFVTVLLILCVAGCEKRLEETKFLMSTIVKITIVGRNSDYQQAIDLAFDEIRRIDDLMNVYSQDSEISRINASAGKSAVEVSGDTLKVISQSLDFARITAGALDITVAPLMELWGFGGEPKRIPSDDELKKILPLVDYKKVLVDENSSTVMIPDEMRIDVSGIAKGYAVDRAIRMLKNAGIRNALVNAGGDIYALGSRARKKSWRIGIRHPRDNTDLLGVLELKDKAVATSGDYENFFEADGKRYCHIINTRTGRPVDGIMSVTIVANSTAEADALATAVFPMGADGGMKLIESLEGVDGIIVTGSGENDMKILLSSGMKGKVQLKQ